MAWTKIIGCGRYSVNENREIRDDKTGYVLNPVTKRLQLEDLESNCGYDRLRALVEADKEGRVVVLPCKLGESVYIPDVELQTVREMSVQRAVIESTGRIILCFRFYLANSVFGDGCGKEWFLTREEAEKALKERQPEK